MKEKLVIITGPTAVGKTELSIKVAKRFHGEIISSDSMQIYKYMDIGTAKITQEEMEGVNHHLIDFLDPSEEFSVYDYKEKATGIIKRLNEIGSLPIVTGGTGLYINSLIYDLNFSPIAPNKILRDKYDKILLNEGSIGLYNLLKELDPVSAEKIDQNNHQRLMRALEVTESSGIPFSKYNKDFRKESQKYDLAYYCLNMDREKLYDRINLRVDIMLEKGLIGEVSNLLNKGYNKDMLSMKAIGYKEIILYLEGIIPLSQAIEMIKQGSRNYAKRQLTWFRRDNRIKWIDVDSYQSKDEMIDFVIKDVSTTLNI